MPCVGGQSRLARFARPASAAFLVADGGTAGDGVKVRRRVRRPGPSSNSLRGPNFFPPVEHTPGPSPSPCSSPPNLRARIFSDRSLLGEILNMGIEKNRGFSKGFDFNETVFFGLILRVFLRRSSLMKGNYDCTCYCLLASRAFREDNWTKIIG